MYLKSFYSHLSFTFNKSFSKASFQKWVDYYNVMQIHARLACFLVQYNASSLSESAAVIFTILAFYFREVRTEFRYPNHDQFISAVPIIPSIFFNFKIW